jgi:transposase
MNSQNSSVQPFVSIGVDWADRKHDAWIMAPRGGQDHEVVEHDPAVIAQWVASLKERFPGHRLLIALEQSRGPLIAALAGYPELELYPLNPKQLSSYRDALYPSGRKNDRVDAELLARFLASHRDAVRPWRPDSVETRQIAALSELRRKLVDERKRLVSKLRSTLKVYFPLLLKLTKRDLHNDLILDLLRRWPTLEQLQRAHPRTLRQFFAKYRIADEDRHTKLIETIRAAVALTKDKAIVETNARYVQVLARQVGELNEGISDFEDQLQELVAQHPDAPLFRACPGAGDAMVPRLIAGFGSDRDRYQSAEELQCYSGIAPIEKESGNSKFVLKRIGCPTFLRQTFHEFADHARKWSTWSRAFYQMKRAAGMKHQAAVRTLAYKWIRILFRCWKTRTPYSEATYLAQLRRKGSPIVAFLEPA